MEMRNMWDLFNQTRKKARVTPRRSNLVEERRRGFLQSVSNPKGTKKCAYVYEGMNSGYSARYSTSGRTINVRSRSAETLARKLARSGHKRVSIRD